MRDEEVQALARRALESSDPTQLVRVIDAVVRQRLSAAALDAEPKPDVGPWREEEGRHEMPPPRGYRQLPAASRVTQRLRGVVAIDNEPLYDRVLIRPYEAGEFVFFGMPVGAYDEGHQKTRIDTNMLHTGRIPDPESFEVTGVSLIVREDAPEEFVTWLRHETCFEIRIGGGTATPSDRQPTWCLTRKKHSTRTGAVLADELYTRTPVFEYPKDATLIIEHAENFYACLVASRGWTPFDETAKAPHSVRCILHGYHGKGIRGA